MSPTEPHIVEWYRADPWPKMRRILVIGPIFLTLGGLVIAVSFLTHQPLAVRVDAALAGFALIAAAAGFTLLSMHRILREEVSLVLRTDGVFIQSAASEILIAWDDLRAVRWDPATTSLIFERRGGEPVVLDRPPARIGGPELAARVLHQKRKTDMNLQH